MIIFVPSTRSSVGGAENVNQTRRYRERKELEKQVMNSLERLATKSANRPHRCSIVAKTSSVDEQSPLSIMQGREP